MSEQVGVAGQHYWLDKNGNVTTDENAGETWIVREGSPITKEMVDNYGIGKVAQTETGDESAAIDETASVEKSSKPSANKAAKAKENK